MPSLQLRAGPSALKKIQQNGLGPKDIAAVSGAAGGPKWLVLSGFDDWLFDEWLMQRDQPLPLIGSSAGAWRMLAACNGGQTRKAFAEAYINQRYDSKPTADEISKLAQHVLDRMHSAERLHGLLEHPIYRPQLITARCNGGLASDSVWAQRSGGAAAFARNMVSRNALNKVFERVVFHDPRLRYQLADDAFLTDYVELHESNQNAALMATASIPLVMNGVRDPAKARPGLYRDGGVIDYHMDLPLPPQEGIVLLAHFAEKVVPGWLDKSLPWRRAQNLDDVLLINPSAEFIASLPDQKVPCRKDFNTYFLKDDARIKNWWQVIKRSDELAEEMRELMSSGDLAAHVQPL